MRVLKGIVHPSSPDLNWKTVSGLLSLACTQSQWSPMPGKWKSRGLQYPRLDLTWMERYYQFVDAATNKMGKIPVLCDILVQGLSLYPNSPRGKKLEIIPCGKLLNSFCTDDLVAVSEIADGGRLVKSLVLYELKKTVAHHLVSVDENYLAQAIVEAYYALLGGEVDLPSIVVGLTDVGTTHYFHLRFPVMRI